jgi:hypothetical protein
MKNLYNETDKNEIVSRINKLTPNSQRQWGKMDVPHMLAHCHASLGTATGDNNTPWLFIGKLISRFTRKNFLSEKVFDKNYPTDKTYVFTGQLDFEQKKSKLISLIEKFYNGGYENCTTGPHPFYGKLTPQEWGIAMYKHFDHHLRQFGV